MEFNEILALALPVVYVVVGLALIWFIVELVMTLRKTRKAMTQVEPVIESVSRITADLEPTVKHVEQVVAQLEPAAAKIDPLVDRVTLTIDAANLEIMRVDQILEDVTQITDTVSNTLDTVDTVTNAPLELISSVTDKFRTKKPQGASKESIGLGASKAGDSANPVRELVDAAADAISNVADSVRSR